MTCVLMRCLEIVEVHAPDRVMRQFDSLQNVLAIPSWKTDHDVHDQCIQIGRDNFFHDWGNQRESTVDDGTCEVGYGRFFYRQACIRG